MPDKRMHVEEIIYEDGTIGYRNSPMISNDKSVGGKAIAVAGVNDLELTHHELRQKMAESRHMKAELMGSHEVVIRPKNKRELQEDRDRAQERAQRKHQK